MGEVSLQKSFPYSGRMCCIAPFILKLFPIVICTSISTWLTQHLLHLRILAYAGIVEPTEKISNTRIHIHTHTNTHTRTHTISIII